MYAVEFETIVHDHKIHIPAEFAEFESREVKVILMMGSKTPGKSMGIHGNRTPGTAKGQIFMSDDFEQPLDEGVTNLQTCLRLNHIRRK